MFLLSNRKTSRRLLVLLAILISLISFAQETYAARLKVGVAKIDITPPKSVPLWGQFNLRLSQGAETPLTANATVLESVEGDQSLDSALFVSCDLLQISDELLAAVCEKVKSKDPSINPEKIVLNGTHTHTAPTLVLNSPELPKSDDIMNYEEIIDFLSEKISDVAIEAWKNRDFGKMTWGLDQMPIASSRRTVFNDGKTIMYANPNQENFDHFENLEDHDIGALFFWNEKDELLSIIVNVSCPSQVVEHHKFMNADYWNPVRQTLAERFGENVVILGWCGAGADSSPHYMYRKPAIERMRQLRGLNEMQDIARRIDQAIGNIWETVKDQKLDDIPFSHVTKRLELPMRKVTEDEYLEAKKECENIEAQLKANPNASPAEVAFMAINWHGDVVKRYQNQQENPNPCYPTTIHVIRIADTAICTNQFELFTDFGIRMKSRSPANQTFVVQLVGNGTYLPNERAVKGGGYSAIIQSNEVGPEGGTILVNETVNIMQELWK